MRRDWTPDWVAGYYLALKFWDEEPDAPERHRELVEQAVRAFEIEYNIPVSWNAVNEMLAQLRTLRELELELTEQV